MLPEEKKIMKIKTFAFYLIVYTYNVGKKCLCCCFLILFFPVYDCIVSCFLLAAQLPLNQILNVSLKKKQTQPSLPFLSVFFLLFL